MKDVKIHDCPTCQCGGGHLVTSKARTAQCICGWSYTNSEDEQAVSAQAHEHVRTNYGRADR